MSHVKNISKLVNILFYKIFFISVDFKNSFDSVRQSFIGIKKYYIEMQQKISSTFLYREECIAYAFLNYLTCIYPR